MGPFQIILQRVETEGGSKTVRRAEYIGKKHLEPRCSYKIVLMKKECIPKIWTREMDERRMPTNNMTTFDNFFFHL